jgi:hypothetical protein
LGGGVFPNKAGVADFRVSYCKYYGIYLFLASKFDVSRAQQISHVMAQLMVSGRIFLLAPPGLTGMR